MHHTRGYILISALVFLGTMLLMSAGTVNYARQYLKNEHRSVADAQALALAEAGIDQAIYQLNQNASYTGETNTTLPGGTFVTSITTDGSGNKRISSTGYVPSQSAPTATKSVRLSISVGNTNVSFHYGVQVGEGGFVMDGGSTINGSIYSNGNIVATNGTRITGAAIAANPAATSSDQANDTPTPITTCTSSTCITFGDSSATQDLAQSFQLSNGLPLNSVQFYIKKIGSPSDETIRIVNDNSGAPDPSTTLLSGTLSASQVTTSFSWVSVTLPSTPVLQAGRTYWIVIDGSNNASKYYTIGANSNYANGQAKVGKYSGTWSNTSPSGLDGYFRIYTGGGTSKIGGATYVGGVVIGSTASDDAWAHTVQGTSVSGTIYCQIGTYNNKSCNTSRADPTPAAMPLSNGNIQDWKDDATAGGSQTGDVTVGYAGATMGPKKIVGNLTVNGGGTLTLTGTLYVTGNVTITGGGKVTLSSIYGGNDGAIVTDGMVAINGGANFSGSGTPGSYPFVITTSACPAAAGCNGTYAIAESGGAGTVALIAQDGYISINGGSALKAVTGKQVYMSGGATLTYDSGLINSNFYSGPGGSWQIVPDSYAIVQ